MSKKLQLLYTVLVYAVAVLIGTVFFIVLFHTPLFKNLDVFFYRGCILLIISALFASCLVLAARRLLVSLDLEIKDVLVVFFLFTGFTLGWFTLLPVTVERSISVFMLSYMEQNDAHEITTDEFADIFYDTYIEGFGAFDKRFREQIVSGNITQGDTGEGYVITDNGRFIVNMFRLCSSLFDTEQWLVYPNQYAVPPDRN